MSLLEMQRAMTARALQVPEAHYQTFIETGLHRPVDEPVSTPEPEMPSKTSPEAEAMKAAEVADIITTVATGGIGARIHERHEAVVPPCRTVTEQDLIAAYFADLREDNLL